MGSICALPGLITGFPAKGLLGDSSLPIERRDFLDGLPSGALAIRVARGWIDRRHIWRFGKVSCLKNVVRFLPPDALSSGGVVSS